MLYVVLIVLCCTRSSVQGVVLSGTACGGTGRAGATDWRAGSSKLVGGGWHVPIRGKASFLSTFGRFPVLS
eukprot:3781726-Rhodomonas_salina.1